MSYWLVDVTAWHIDNFDPEQEPCIKIVDSLEESHLHQAALEAAYDIASSLFDEHEDYVYGGANVSGQTFGEDKERGYTEYNGTVYIEAQTIICNNPETNQLQVIYSRNGDYIECWTKPEEEVWKS